MEIQIPMNSKEALKYLQGKDHHEFLKESGVKMQPFYKMFSKKYYRCECSAVILARPPVFCAHILGHRHAKLMANNPSRDTLHTT